jgi:NAD(P)-dependent dehydrogenase (short-subunit alcohol dehydrogenase family)
LHRDPPAAGAARNPIPGRPRDIQRAAALAAAVKSGQTGARSRIGRRRMAADFAGKIVLVTGGGNGIGAATCRAFAEGGAEVAVLDRDRAAAERVASEIAATGGKAAPHLLDVADGAAFRRVAAVVAARSGGIDILVNCAGTTVRRTLEAMQPEDWERVIVVNLTGAFNGIQAVLPYLRRRGGGAIVNIASIAGRRISFGGTANYTASKAGLLGLTRHAAYELAPDNIRVNAVCPGPTATGFGGAQRSAEEKAAAGRKIPLGRMIEPEDVADAVLFLAGPRARMITGVALDVDGGVLISNNVPYDEYFHRN